MADDRVVMMSTQGYQNLVGAENGKGLHWATDVKQELPIKIRPSGMGSERPMTISELFLNCIAQHGPRNSMYVERDGKIVSYTWNDYKEQAFLFAKGLAKLKVEERSCISIMGFNSPEWVIGFVGGILYNLVATGIYATNAPEACLYQVDHSESEVILVENNEYLQRFTKNLDQMPRIKAIIVWGEESLPTDIKDGRIMLLKDFMKLGADLPDSMILEKVSRQKPGECAVLIYTSGTTGNPKGCMLSHDACVWEQIPIMTTWAKIRPEIMSCNNRVVSYLPLSHIAGLSVDVLTHFLNGHELYFARPDALQGTIAQTLAWARPTMFFAVPRVWEKFEEKLKEIASTKPAFMQSISGWAKGHGFAHVKAKEQGKEVGFMYSVAHALILSKIKAALGLDQAVAFLYGAAPMKQSTIDYFASLDMAMYNVYGMSETTGSTTLHTEDNFRLDSAGFCLPGCDLKIDQPDEKGEGEICMRGRNTMMGYLKNDQATMDTIDSQGFVHSGDRGKILPDGHLKITGRIKELIITGGGENVAPVPIEDNFKECCPPCSNIMLLGEAQKFMACIITFKVDIDMKSGLPSQNLTNEAVNFFKKELGLTLKTAKEAIADPKVNEFIKSAIAATNKKSVSRAAHIRKFKLIGEDFSIPGGELTPTMKLKRKVTEKKYQKEVDELFNVEAKL